MNTHKFKQCSRKALCLHPKQVSGGWLPATAEYFHRSKNRPDGLNPPCKSCESQRKKDDRQIRPDELHAIEKMKRERRIDHYREQGRKTTAAYRSKNHETVLERTRQWKKDNQSHISAYNKWYRETNPHKNDESYEKRQRLRSLPRNFGEADWQFALEYFDYRCAVCGASEHGDLVLSPDHWIPLADPRPDNPGTVPVNILPLCFGIGGCQGSKHALDPVTWIKRRLGETEGESALDEIHAYFKLLTSQQLPD